MPRSQKTTRMVWHLDRYARFFFTKAQVEGEWEQYDDVNAPLTATLTELHDFVIQQETTVLESFHLPSCKDYIRGMSRTDSLLVLYKCQGNTRRFRIRFKPTGVKTGQEIGEECVAKLSQYFLIKEGAPRNIGAATGVQNTKPVVGTSSAKTITDREIPVQNGSVNITKSVGAVSKNHQSTSDHCIAQHTYRCPESLVTSFEENNSNIDLPLLLKRCLSDPAFPAFVARVEQAIDDMTKTQTTPIE